MTYANIAALLTDEDFAARLSACCCEQALIYKDDARANFVALATDVLLTGSGAMFLPFVAGQPGFGDVTDQSEITDGQLLGAVQATWPVVAEMRYGTPA